MNCYARRPDGDLGPISEEALRALAATGQLDADTLVRREDEAEWLAAGSVPGLIQPPPPAPVAAAVEPDAAADSAGPWRRFWARQCDLLLLAMLIGFLIGAVQPSILLAFARFGAFADQVLGWVLLPAVIVAEAAVHALFGTTPGKSLAGLRVRDVDGNSPDFWTYLRRSFGVWWYGLGTGFPFLTLVTQVLSYQRVKSGEAAVWDLRNDTRVIAVSPAPVRTWIAAGAWLLLIALSAVLSTIGRPTT
jgi:uncharacterized RDD family membrane protein YckC